VPLDLVFDRLVQLDVLITDGQFHGCTYRTL
jgi:hypothetical protein